MKIRYRELKRAFMDNQDDNFMYFLHSVYFKLFIATSGPLFPDYRSPSSKGPGISKYFEPGNALGHTGTLVAARKLNLVFLFFFLWESWLLHMHVLPENVSADSQTYFQSCALCRRSRGYLKHCSQLWQYRGKLHPSQSDGFDWVCPLHTQPAALIRKRVGWLPNMSHR